MRMLCLALATIFIFQVSNAQETVVKKLAAQRLSASLKIDGNLDDAGWKNIIPATDFIEWRPNPGRPSDPSVRTEIYIAYDNTAIYVAGYCHERTVDSVSKELVGRDKVGANDFVGIIFDTYLDKINGMGFYVTPLGEQYDARYYPSDNGGEDDSWNAVWDSESKLQKDGWTFEMRIPYSALRFSSKDVQTWGLNITRRRQKTGQQYMWNEVDPKKNGFINQFGEWTGIEKIQPPLRLSFMPYFSAYLNHYPYNEPGKKNTTSSVNGGMDVKYGINQSFTLDMTLIPDFGQVQSDNQVLNLTPFEVKYNENRAFFTEGTELFSKGNLFYSRRIGGTPIHYGDVGSSLNSNEHIVRNPSESKLINATKISGRTKGKFGLGFFNAITESTYATVEDDVKQSRKIETAPLTNYNILVLDQSLKNNSSVSLVNTNVWRSGNDYDANVTAGLFNLNNKKNTYNISGKLANSRLLNVNGKNISGYSYNLGLGKTGGRLNIQFNQELTDDKYNPNDMGILFNNNYLDHYLWVGYRWLKPGKWYNRVQINYNFSYSRRFNPGDYQSISTNINANSQLKNLWWVGIFTDFQPEQNDFYEPRTNGRRFRRPASNSLDLWFETNRAKKYSGYMELFGRKFHDFNGKFMQVWFNHKYRFNDRLSISHDGMFDRGMNRLGFATKSGSDPIFGLRDIWTIENILNVKYSFTNRMGITMRMRHYWSEVEYRKFYDLQMDGTVKDNTTFNSNVDQNFNAFNIDMVYTWQFAPGSFINIVWKNSIYGSNQRVDDGYFKNFSNTLESPQNNSLSLKVIYFLDYLQLKKKR